MIKSRFNFSIWIILLMISSVSISYSNEAWTKIPFSGGDIVKMESFPDNPSIMLCCLMEKGFYKSIDRGENWYLVIDIEVYDIATSSNGVGYTASREGLFKTADYGNTWTKILNHTTWQVITAFDNIVIADTASCIRKSVYKDWDPWIISYSEGMDWQIWTGTECPYDSRIDRVGHVIKGPVKRGSILFHNSGRVIRTEGTRIFRSACEDWSQWEQVYCSNSTDHSIIYLSSQRSSKSTIYGYAKTYTSPPTGYLIGGVFYSKDEGESWYKIKNLGSVTALSDLDSILIVGDESFLTHYHISSEGSRYLGRFGCPITSIDTHSWNTGELIISTREGIFKTTDHGLTWEKSDRGIYRPRITSVQTVVLFDNTERIILGTQNSGIWISDDQGNTWQCSHPYIQIGFGLMAKSSLSDNTIYGASNVIFISTDKGENWLSCNDFPAVYYGWESETVDIDIDPEDSYRLVVNYCDHSIDHYIGIVYADGSYSADNNDWSWNTYNWFDMDYNASARAQFDLERSWIWISRYFWGKTVPALIAVDCETNELQYEISLPDSTSADIWLIDGVNCYIFSNDSKRFWHSIDLGTTWVYNEIEIEKPDFPWQNYWYECQSLGKIVLSPDRSQLYFMYPGNGVVRSENGGSSWILINDKIKKITGYQLAFSSINPTRMYLAASDGLYIGENIQSSEVTVYVESDTLYRSIDNQKLLLILENIDREVNNLPVDILYDTDCFSVSAVNKVVRTDSMDIFNYSTIDGGIRVAMTGIGTSIPTGSGPIAEIIVDVEKCDEGNYIWEATNCFDWGPLSDLDCIGLDAFVYIKTLKHDVNNDGKVDIMDVLAIVEHILRISQLSQECFVRADMNSDRQLNSLDIVQLVNFILGA